LSILYQLNHHHHSEQTGVQDPNEIVRWGEYISADIADDYMFDLVWIPGHSVEVGNINLRNLMRSVADDAESLPAGHFHFGELILWGGPGETWQLVQTLENRLMQYVEVQKQMQQLEQLQGEMRGVKNKIAAWDEYYARWG